MISIGGGRHTVGTLKDGYIRKVPLPRIPRIQSPSALVANVATATSNSHDTCYVQVPRVPTWSDILRSLSGLGQISHRPFFACMVDVAIN